jgi:hypothetical protein
LSGLLSILHVLNAGKLASSALVWILAKIVRTLAWNADIRQGRKGGEH